MVGVIAPPDRVDHCDGGEWLRRSDLARAVASDLSVGLTPPQDSGRFIIDEVGCIPLDGEAANLFFQLVSARYERARVIVTSNKPFGRWGEVFGNAVAAAAMVDRLVYYAEVVSLRGDGYRLKDRDLGRVPTDDPT
jgi:hypothetical protein